jgi:hypothetical protein
MGKNYCSFRSAHASGPITAHAPRFPPPSPPLLGCRPTGNCLHRAHAMPAVQSPPSMRRARATDPPLSPLPLARAMPDPCFSPLLHPGSNAAERFCPPPPLTVHPRRALPARFGCVTASPLITPMSFVGPEHGRSPSTTGFVPTSRLHLASRCATSSPLLTRAHAASATAPHRPACHCELCRHAGRSRGDYAQCASRTHARPARRVGPAMLATCPAGGRYGLLR